MLDHKWHLMSDQLSLIHLKFVHVAPNLTFRKDSVLVVRGDQIAGALTNENHAAGLTGTKLFDVAPKHDRAHGPTNQNRVSHAGSVDKVAHVDRVLLHRVSSGRLVGAAMAPEIKRKDTVALRQLVHIAAKPLQTAGPPVEQHDRAAFALIHV